MFSNIPLREEKGTDCMLFFDFRQEESLILLNTKLLVDNGTEGLSTLKSYGITIVEVINVSHIEINSERFFQFRKRK